MDHAREYVRINCVCPGFVDTPLTARFFAAQADPGEAREHVAAMHAVGRLAQPGEIARAVVFLASDEASFITGSALVVDGGITIGHKA